MSYYAPRSAGVLTERARAAHRIQFQEPNETGSRAPHDTESKIFAGGTRPTAYLAQTKDKKTTRSKARSKARRKSARRAAEKASSVQQSAAERHVKDVARKKYAQGTEAVKVDISMHGMLAIQILLHSVC